MGTRARLAAEHSTHSSRLEACGFASTRVPRVLVCLGIVVLGSCSSRIDDITSSYHSPPDGGFAGQAGASLGGSGGTTSEGGSGGSPAVASALYVSSDACPWQLATDGTYLYWGRAAKGVKPGGIERMSIAGGNPTTIAPVNEVVLSLTVRPPNLGWVDGLSSSDGEISGRVTLMPLSGGEMKM